MTYAHDLSGRRPYNKDALRIAHSVWDGNRLLEEVRGSHARTHLYQPESFVPLAQVSRNDTPNEDANRSKEPAQVLHMHTDHLGTPREMTDEQGKLRWAAAYRAWGNVLRVEMPEAIDLNEGQAQRQAFEEVQPLRFQGQYTMPRRGCITIGSGITTRIAGGSCRRIRLACRAGSTHMYMC